MGQVFAAEDLNLRRPVALKFLSQDQVPDSEARHRLLTEARLASRLNHPNIATIYEVNEAEELPYIAMELVEGESLRAVLDRGSLPVVRLVELGRQIAGALQSAHRQGILHLDLKPANVMVTSKGDAKVLDFGLAILVGHERHGGEKDGDFLARTATSATAGTVPYMAPELLRGDAADERADVFALGVLLYECLTGHRPWLGESAIDVCLKILHEPVPTVADRLPDGPGSWDGFLGRCLAKDKRQRFQSMQEVIDALEGMDRPLVSRKKAVAVLYFENMSEDKEDSYFRDGMTEDIITECSRIGELDIFPRSSVLPFKDELLTAPQIGKRLGADYVLEGSLRRASNRLRITARLVESRTGYSVWADRYDRQMEDVFAIQEEIASNIALALRVVLSDEEKRQIQKPPTSNVEAYDFYLRGMQYFHQFKRKSFEQARLMFERAIELDPEYARAHCGLADSSSHLFVWCQGDDEDREHASASSRRALELDPNLAEAHASYGLALSLENRMDEAVREFETAIRLNPNLFEAYFFFARVRWAQGHLEDALALFERAATCRPADYQTPGYIGTLLDGLGRPAEARAAHRRCLDVIGKHLRHERDDARAIYLGALSLASLGESSRAIAWAQRALAINPGESNTLYNVACLYSMLDRPAESVEYLRKAIRCGFHHREWIENDPDLLAARAHPDYEALLAELS
jgi:serine/threonine protein kinase/Flp pilus assembly protein TadD